MSELGATSPSEEVAPFLPTLEMARGAAERILVSTWWRRGSIDVLARAPSREQRVAALFAIVRAHDGGVLLRYPYVPSMPFALEEGLARLYERQTIDPPECLRVEIERREGDPYRGLPSTPRTFHGFDYAQALAPLRRVLAQLRAAHSQGALEVLTFALPVLWLTYGGLLRREIALVVRPDRVLHALHCRGRWL